MMRLARWAERYHEAKAMVSVYILTEEYVLRVREASGFVRAAAAHYNAAVLLPMM